MLKSKNNRDSLKETADFREPVQKELE